MKIKPLCHYKTLHCRHGVFNACQTFRSGRKKNEHNDVESNFVSSGNNRTLVFASSFDDAERLIVVERAAQSNSFTGIGVAVKSMKNGTFFLRLAVLAAVDSEVNVGFCFVRTLNFQWSGPAQNMSVSPAKLSIFLFFFCEPW
jgi:hypothetical protein